jgi:hypothetical protein
MFTPSMHLTLQILIKAGGLDILEYFYEGSTQNFVELCSRQPISVRQPEEQFKTNYFQTLFFPAKQHKI